jgi:topoisomerase IV subunit B
VPADALPEKTTHDWGRAVDGQHLAEIRRRPSDFAPTGVLHLILEVVAYAADEAAHIGGGRCSVSGCADGSIVVADHGRGTDTRLQGDGHAIKKPVISTRDLRFFTAANRVTLPDGHQRFGMSVVAALSEWLVHVNRRSEGAWQQRYERGLPVTELTPVASDGSYGTTVQFLPDRALCPVTPLRTSDVERISTWPKLTVVVSNLAGIDGGDAGNH